MKITINNENFVKTLEELKNNKSNNHIELNYLAGAQYYQVMEALKTDKIITHVTVRCPIGDLTAIALAEVLRVNNVITNLDLRSNGITDNGAIALAEVLKTGRYFESLDLRSGNEGHTIITHYNSDFNNASYDFELNYNSDCIGVCI